MYVNKWPRKTTSEAGAQGQGKQQAAEATLLAAAGIQASKRGLHGHCRTAPGQIRRNADAEPRRRLRVARQSPPAHIEVLYSLFIFSVFLFACVFFYFFLAALFHFGCVRR